MDWLTTVFVGPVVDPSRRTGPQNRKYYFNQSVTNPATVPPIHPLAYQEGRKQTTDSSSQPTENAVGVHIPSTPVVAWNWRVHCFTTSLQLRRQYLLSSSVWCKHRNCVQMSPPMRVTMADLFITQLKWNWSSEFNVSRQLQSRIDLSDNKEITLIYI